MTWSCCPQTLIRAGVSRFTGASSKGWSPLYLENKRLSPTRYAHSAERSRGSVSTVFIIQIIIIVISFIIAIFIVVIIIAIVVLAVVLVLFLTIITSAHQSDLSDHQSDLSDPLSQTYTRLSSTAIATLSGSSGNPDEN